MTRATAYQKRHAKASHCPHPPGPGTPCRDELRWMQSMLDGRVAAFRRRGVALLPPRSSSRIGRCLLRPPGLALDGLLGVVLHVTRYLQGADDDGGDHLPPPPFAKEGNGGFPAARIYHAMSQSHVG